MDEKRNEVKIKCGEKCFQPKKKEKEMQCFLVRRENTIKICMFDRSLIHFQRFLARKKSYDLDNQVRPINCSVLIDKQIFSITNDHHSCSNRVRRLSQMQVVVLSTLRSLPINMMNMNVWQPLKKSSRLDQNNSNGSRRCRSPHRRSNPTINKTGLTLSHQRRRSGSKEDFEV